MDIILPPPHPPQTLIHTTHILSHTTHTHTYTFFLTPHTLTHKHTHTHKHIHTDLREPVLPASMTYAPTPYRPQCNQVTHKLEADTVH